MVVIFFPDDVCVTMQYHRSALRNLGCNHIGEEFFILRICLGLIEFIEHTVAQYFLLYGCLCKREVGSAGFQDCVATLGFSFEGEGVVAFWTLIQDGSSRNVHGLLGIGAELLRAAILIPG